MDSRKDATNVVQKLFLQYAPALRGFILGLVRDPDASDDILQEVFVAVARQAAAFRPDGSFLAWARGIARNKVRDHFTRVRMAPRRFDDTLVDVLATAAERREDMWEERRAALKRCIRQLAPRARQILELRYAEEPLTPLQIALRLAWTVNAVHVALARARKFLQQCTHGVLSGQEV